MDCSIVVVYYNIPVISRPTDFASQSFQRKIQALEVCELLLINLQLSREPTYTDRYSTRREAK